MTSTTTETVSLEEAVSVLFRERHRLSSDVLRSLDCIWLCASAARFGEPHEERSAEHDAAYCREHDVTECEAEAEASHFGVCPECGKNDGYINVGKSHWFYCRAHKVCWLVGANLFSSWQDQTEAEQKTIYEEMDFGSYRHVTSATAGAEARPSEYGADCPF